MNAIGILSFISGLTLNHASTSCQEPTTSSSCYNTAINDNNVYCYGYSSCQYTEITATFTLRCDGYYACSYSDEIESPGSSIYCGGKYGCFSVDAITAGNTLYCDGDWACAYAGDLSASTIYCSGDYGCYRVSGDITATGYVYCDGKYGCYDADDGTISGSYVEATGILSAYNTKIEATYDVTCGGEHSCDSATIIAGDDVLIQAHGAADSATITATDRVFCNGDWSCYGAVIRSDSNVYVHGDRAAADADIYASKVYVYGFKGIVSATIWDQGDESLYVYLYGWQSGYNADIRCSTCYVYCYSEQACDGVLIFYEGSYSDVYVYPENCKSYTGTTNHDGVYCPSLVSSSSMSEEEFKAMRKQEFEKSDEYKNFRKEIEEAKEKVEEKRQAIEKEANARLAMINDNGEESVKNQMFGNVNGLLQDGQSGKNLLYSSYGMITFMMGGLLTFVVMSCYSRWKDQTVKYQTLL